jgi:hypothetical protein
MVIVAGCRSLNTEHSRGDNRFTRQQNVTWYFTRKGTIISLLALLLISPKKYWIKAEKGADTSQAPPEEKERGVGKYAPYCKFGPTVACKNGKPNLEILRLGGWLGMDCMAIDTIMSMTAEPRMALEDWTDACQTLFSEKQESPMPPSKATIKTPIISCTLPDNHVISSATVDGADDIVKMGGVNCSTSIASVDIDLYPCAQKKVSICKNGQLDTSVFDATLRADCGAHEVREDFVQYCIEGLHEWEELCSLRRVLPYTNDCAGSNIQVRETLIYVSHIAIGSDWHWHLRINGNNVRGLSFTPLLTALNVKQCSSDVCTVTQDGLSCWPRPSFASGPVIGYTTARIFTCLNSPAMSWHLSGYFHGVVEVYGKVTGTPGGACSVTTKDGLVRVSTVQVASCSVYVELSAGWELTAEAYATRNVCTGQ